MNHLGVPDGTGDRVYGDAEALRARENALAAFLRERGYREVSTPAVEYYDLFVAAGSALPQTRMQTATARNGRVLVMRPDSTVPLARVAATRLVAEDFPLRLFCCQSVLRSDSAHRGHRAERRQAGVELMGLPGMDAEVELLRLAAEALRVCGAEFQLELSHAKRDTRYLEQLQARLEALGVPVVLDLELQPELGFYTGLMFRAYVPGAGEPVLSGGRYDELLGQLGRPGPAAGFAIDLDAFASAAEPFAPRPLRVALTKGRLEKRTAALLKRCGADVSALEDPGRRLLLPVPNWGLEVVLAKAADVVTYVGHGVCELGVVGRDTLLEQGQDCVELLDLGFGACRFALAAAAGADFWNTVKTRRIATKYPQVARKFFAERNLDVEIIKIEGSVELAPLLGLADGIVDIVETGATLKANGLEPIEDIADISARVVANVAALKTRKGEIERTVAALKGGLV